MKLVKLNFFIICLLVCSKILGQDGSDIGYGNFDDIDSTYIGKKIHIDFYRNSFHAFNLNNIDLTDTVSIKIRGDVIKFREHREDDGYNNWFNDQYLESVETYNGLKIRVSYFIFQSISERGVWVKLILRYIGKSIDPKLTTMSSIEYFFPKDIIAAILVKQ